MWWSKTIKINRHPDLRAMRRLLNGTVSKLSQTGTNPLSQSLEPIRFTQAVAWSKRSTHPSTGLGDTLGGHLEFALKYDGTNLAILTTLFQKITEKDFLEYVGSIPTGKYARRLWFLYEFLTGKTLPLDDVKQGNYVDLLDPFKYYTVTPVRRVRRQRINDNLLGDSRFCPMVRRTDVLSDFEAADLPNLCRQVVASYPPELLKRALGYLYTKETKSSFEIEHIKPTSTRTERFLVLLQLAEQEDFCKKTTIDRASESHCWSTVSRFRLPIEPELCRWDSCLAERKDSFCMPETWRPGRLDGRPDSCPQAHEHRQRVHRDSCRRYRLWIVFLHPFEDGNGRIHRFLIHNILARQGFTPEGVMFPRIGIHAKESCRLWWLSWSVLPADHAPWWNTRSMKKASWSFIMILTGGTAISTWHLKQRHFLSSSSRLSIRNLQVNLHSWPTMMRQKGPYRKSWTCPTGRSTFSSGSVCRTMAGSQKGNAQTTLVRCRRTKSIASNRPFNPPTKVKSQTMNDKHSHAISIIDNLTSLTHEEPARP